MDPPGGPGRVGVPSERSGMSQGTVPEVRDGSGTLSEVQDGSGTLSQVQDGLEDPLGGLGRVGTPGRSMTGRGTHREVRNGSGEPSVRSGTGRGTI